MLPSKSFASCLLRLIQVKNRSTTQRRTMTAKPAWLSALRTTSMRIGLSLATRTPVPAASRGRRPEAGDRGTSTFA